MELGAFRLLGGLKPHLTAEMLWNISLRNTLITIRTTDLNCRFGIKKFNSKSYQSGQNIKLNWKWNYSNLYPKLSSIV